MVREVGLSQLTGAGIKTMFCPKVLSLSNYSLPNHFFTLCVLFSPFTFVLLSSLSSLGTSAPLALPHFFFFFNLCVELSLMPSLELYLVLSFFFKIFFFVALSLCLAA